MNTNLIESALEKLAKTINIDRGRLEVALIWENTHWQWIARVWSSNLQTIDFEGVACKEVATKWNS